MILPGQLKLLPIFAVHTAAEILTPDGHYLSFHSPLNSPYWAFALTTERTLVEIINDLKLLNQWSVVKLCYWTNQKHWTQLITSSSLVDSPEHNSLDFSSHRISTYFKSPLQVTPFLSKPLSLQGRLAQSLVHYSVLSLLGWSPWFK